MYTTNTPGWMPIGLLGIVAVVSLAAGCLTSSEEGDTHARAARAPAAPAEAEQQPAEQAAEAEPIAEPGPAAKAEEQPAAEAEPTVQTPTQATEPSLLAEQPQAQPIPPPGPADAEPAIGPAGPARLPVEEPVGTVNPLRQEPSPATGSPPIERPPITSNQSTASTRPRPGREAAEPFDPIKVNGKILVGWPRPKLALVITGQQDGYIEPCGCAGLDRMKGGMSRRYSLFQQLRQWGWPVVGLDVGGVAKGYGRQAELKFHTLVESMRMMGYSAIALGTTDLQLQTGELAVDAASDEHHQSPFLSANVALFGFAAKMTAQKRVVEAGGMRLGITAILGKKFQQQISSDEIEFADPQAALAAIVPELKREADYLILLAHATPEESQELGRKFPQFDLVVTAGGDPEPPDKPAHIDGTKTLLVEVGEKGMQAIVLGIYDKGEPIRYQRVPLDSRFAASPQMRMLMTGYEEQLKELGFAGLGIPVGRKAPPHPQQQTNGQFVGSAKCESCHEPSYEVWKKSEHAKAYRTLVQAEPPRQFDPECISCHVVGWHPTEHYPYQGGYLSVEKTPELVDVGCESCHGPGGAHVAAEMGSDEALQLKLRQAVVITKAESKERQCYSCHDLDNSPDFDFGTYWPYIEHREDQ